MTFGADPVPRCRVVPVARLDMYNLPGTPSICFFFVYSYPLLFFRSLELCSALRARSFSSRRVSWLLLLIREPEPSGTSALEVGVIGLLVNAPAGPASSELLPLPLSGFLGLDT